MKQPRLFEKKRFVGAGGSWKVIAETADSSVVRQLTPLSCVAATGVMLAQSRGISMTQEAIIARIGAPASVNALAAWLNEIDAPSHERWYGGFISANDFAVLSKAGAWGAVLREGSPLGHLVLVKGLDEQGLVKIKDPFDGTFYKMRPAEFLAHWGGEVVIKWKF